MQEKDGKMEENADFGGFFCGKERNFRDIETSR